MVTSSRLMAIALAVPVLLGAVPEEGTEIAYDGNELCGYVILQQAERARQTEPEPFTRLLFNHEQGPLTRHQIRAPFDRKEFETCYLDWFAENPDSTEGGTLNVVFSVAGDGTVDERTIEPSSTLELEEVRDCAIELIESASFEATDEDDHTSFRMALVYRILMPCCNNEPRPGSPRFGF